MAEQRRKGTPKDVAEETVVMETNLPGLPAPRRGKVRDIYDFGDRLLIVATDRISAFDVVLPTAIPDKGKILTQLSRFWFERTADIVPNHLLSTDVEEFPPPCRPYPPLLAGRSMLVRQANPLPVECIVRGYLAGSAWEEYRQTGSVCGMKVHAGLVESSRLDPPLFTPSTKGEYGEHDVNITFDQAAVRIGSKVAERVRDLSVAIYERAHAFAAERGIIVADTKFEFGFDDETGELMLIDEVLTPDSSRFWPKDGYVPGRPQPSFDKQYIRDYLEAVGWDEWPPGPALPPEVVAQIRARYLEALERLTGRSPVAL
ncbi:MAG: phosphoribosylaminoimidazolesuccinocarboxamide synthase [Candidatus Methylomirabilales bacterium]|jgi:phosphoribosylaminoimidazole-succinocarboxamide synthase|nr:phosphoribosylaminoimidazolesuccinocarboxamide synthase [candidate division NC10 bacterium]